MQAEPALSEPRRMRSIDCQQSGVDDRIKPSNEKGFFLTEAENF